MKFKIICVLLFSAMYHNMVYGLEVTWDARIPSGVYVLDGVFPENQTARLIVPQKGDRVRDSRVLFAREIEQEKTDKGPEQQVPFGERVIVKGEKKSSVCYLLVTPENQAVINGLIDDEEVSLKIEMVDMNGCEYYKIIDESIKTKDACVPNSPKKRKADDQGDESRDTKKLPTRVTLPVNAGPARVAVSLRGVQQPGFYTFGGDQSTIATLQQASGRNARDERTAARSALNS